MRRATALIVSGCLFSFIIFPGPARSEDFPHETAAGKAAGEVQVDRLARYYRIQNYELNRLDRFEYNRRSHELQQRMDAWRDSGQNAEQTHELIEWLSDSLSGRSERAGTPPAISPIETLPKPPENQTATRMLPPPASVKLPSPAATSPGISVDLAPSFSTDEAQGVTGDRSQSEPKPEIESAAAPLPDDGPLSDVKNQGAVAEPDAPKLSAGENPTQESKSILGGLRSTIDDLVKRVEQVAPISQLPDSVPPPVALPQLADVPDAPPFVSPAFEPQTVPKADIDVPQIGGLAELRSGKQPGKADEAKVNFTEVAALARSYNVSLQELETKLSSGTNWTADTLEPLVDELEELGRRRDDLNLYENALPAVERSQLASRDPLDQAVRLTGKRIAEVRKHLTESPEGEEHGQTSLASGAQERRDLEQLNGFSRRLATLAGGNER
jgi:hypothetical protein